LHGFQNRRPRLEPAFAKVAILAKQGEKMKTFPHWLAILAWSAASLGLHGQDRSARVPDRRAVVGLGSLKSRVPADWVEEKPDEAQGYKQYRLEPLHDDEYYARVTVHFLGKKKGDTAAEQVKRWKGMFLPPEGRKLDDVARVGALRVGGAEVTYVRVLGDYKGLPGDPTSRRQNFRLLGVYLGTAKGPYLIQMLGPADTVESYRVGFEDWVKAFK
jgi:hypothetical protein